MRIRHRTDKRPRLRKNPGEAPPRAKASSRSSAEIRCSTSWAANSDQDRAGRQAISLAVLTTLPEPFRVIPTSPLWRCGLRSHLPDLVAAENLRDPRLVFDDGFFEHSHRVAVNERPKLDCRSRRRYPPFERRTGGRWQTAPRRGAPGQIVSGNPSVALARLRPPSQAMNALVTDGLPNNQARHPSGLEQELLA